MNVNIDLSVFYVLICFFIVFAVARNTLWKKLDTILGERHEKIQQSKELAEGNDEIIEEKLNTMNASLAEAREKAYELRSESREEAIREQESIVSDARRKGKEFLEENQRDLEDSVSSARQQMERETEAYARSIADVLLRRPA